MLKHAHRVAWENAHGPIPPGHVIHHVCGDKYCVELDHLQLVTHAEHAAIHDVGRVMNQSKRERTHCIHGHAFDRRNTFIRPNGTRLCRRCHADRERARRVRLARVPSGT